MYCVCIVCFSVKLSLRRHFWNPVIILPYREVCKFADTSTWHMYMLSVILSKTIGHYIITVSIVDMGHMAHGCAS